MLLENTIMGEDFSAAEKSSPLQYPIFGVSGESVGYIGLTDAELSTLSSMQSPFNVPQTDPFGASFNINAGYLSGFNPVVEGNINPSVVTNGTAVTPSNYAKLASDRIMELESQRGRKLSTSESSAILDAYRQMAGLEPRFYSVTPTGAKVDDFGASNVLNNPFVIASDAIASGASNVIEGVSKNLGTIQLAFGAAIVLGIYLLVKS